MYVFYKYGKFINDDERYDNKPPSHEKLGGFLKCGEKKEAKTSKFNHLTETFIWHKYKGKANAQSVLCCFKLCRIPARLLTVKKTRRKRRRRKRRRTRKRWGRKIANELNCSTVRSSPEKMSSPVPAGAWQTTVDKNTRVSSPPPPTQCENKNHLNEA